MWTPSRRRAGRHSERGTAAVEFVIVAPLLILMMIGVAEFGRALYQYSTLTKTVRNADRYLAGNAMVGTLGFVVLSNTLVAQAQNLVVYGNIAGTGTPLLPGLTPSDVTVSSPDSEHVTVSVGYTYQPMTGTTLPTFGLTANPISLAIPLRASITMRGL